MSLVKHLKSGKKKKKTQKRPRQASPDLELDANSCPKTTSPKESENAASNDMERVSPFVSDYTSGNGDVAVDEYDVAPLILSDKRNDVVNDNEDNDAFLLEHSRLWKECQDLADCELLPVDCVLPFDCIGSGNESLVPSFEMDHDNEEQRAPAVLERKDSCPNSRLELTEDELKMAEHLLADLDWKDHIPDSATIHSDKKASPENDAVKDDNDPAAASRKKRKFGNGLASIIHEKILTETSHKERRHEDRVPSSVENSLCVAIDRSGCLCCRDRMGANSGNELPVSDSPVDACKLTTPKAIEEERKSVFMARSRGDEIKSQIDDGWACDSKADLSNLAKSLKHSADAMRDSAGRQRPLSLYFYLCSCINFLLLAKSKRPKGDAADPQRSSSELRIMQQTLLLLEYALKTAKSVASVNQKRVQTHRIVCRDAAISLCETLFLALIAMTKLKLSFIRRRKLRSEFLRVQLMQEDIADDDELNVNLESVGKMRSMNASTSGIIDETLPPIEAMSRSAASAKLAKAKIANVKGKEADALAALLRVSLEMGNWFQMDEVLEGACDKLEPLRLLLDGKD